MTPTRLSRSTLAVVTALVLGGCAGGDGPGTEEVAASTTAPPAPATTTPSGTPDAGSGARGIPTSATVEVLAVEDGCVYVVVGGSGETWALRGEVPSVAVGDRLALTGAPDDTPFADCPDGAPFLVGEVTAAE